MMLFFLLKCIHHKEIWSSIQAQRISHRESFTYKVLIGKFYMCSLTSPTDLAVSEAGGHIRCIYTDPGDTGHVCTIKCDVDVLVNSGNKHSPTKCPIYSDTSNTDVTVSANSISHPVHVIPLCNSNSCCPVFKPTPMPHDFDYNCFGLTGDHLYTGSYVLNMYLVK